MFYGGDTTSNKGYDIDDDIAWERKVAEMISSHALYFPMKGNHDYYNDNVILPISGVRDSILSRCNVSGIVYNENDRAPYYYYDDSTSKIRYIVIDIYYYGPWLEVGKTQLRFVADALCNTPEGYVNVLFAHTAIQNDA